jgi:hypothetical protein
MIFFNKTQTEAAKIVLEKVGYPLGTVQLMAAVEKGGVKIGGKTDAARKQNFYTHPQSESRFRPGEARYVGLGRVVGYFQEGGGRGRRRRGRRQDVRTLSGKEAAK